MNDDTKKAILYDALRDAIRYSIDVYRSQGVDYVHIDTLELALEKFSLENYEKKEAEE